MRYISSDTNIWIDFATVNALSLPFRLDHIYYMSRDALEDEWTTPKGRGNDLQLLGVQAVDITTDEFFYAISQRERNPAISAYDAIALAIAKTRGYILLTGDKALRKAAEKENVEVHGTLWIFDELTQTGTITEDEYFNFMMALKKHNGSTIRLPAAEIEKRIQKFKGSQD